MKLLAIDTATEACSAAVLIDGRIVSRCAELARGHADQILPMVDAVLREAGVTLRELQAVAFGRGPGAFTGLRLAASVAQGLAFGAGLPVVPVSDLAAVAQQVLDAHPAADAVLVCNDARMQEVYWGCFVRGPGGLARPEGEERVGRPESVQIPDALRGSAVHGAGRGFRAHPALAERLGADLAAVHEELLPRADEIARLGAARFAEGGGLPAEQALPVYLRDDVARPPSRS